MFVADILNVVDLVAQGSNVEQANRGKKIRSAEAVAIATRNRAKTRMTR